MSKKMKEHFGGVRLDTPSECGSVTAALVKETRTRLDLAGYKDVKMYKPFSVVGLLRSA